MGSKREKGKATEPFHMQQSENLGASLYRNISEERILTDGTN